MLERRRVPAPLAFSLALLAMPFGAAPAGAEALTLGPSRLPLRGAAPTHLSGCEAFGDGYTKLPGTDTCIRVGGQVRFETSIISGGPSATPRGR